MGFQKKIGQMLGTLLVVCGMLLGFSMSAEAEHVSILEHPTVAVYPFKNEGIVSDEWKGENMSEFFTQAVEIIGDSDKLNIVERADMKKIADEIYFQHTGLVDPTTSAELGKIKGAQYLVIGSILGVTTRKGETTVVGAGTKRASVTAVVNLRIVDVETSEVVLSATGRSKKTNTMVKAPLGLIRIGTDDVDKQQVLDALLDATDDAVEGERGLVAKMEGKAKPRQHRH